MQPQKMSESPIETVDESPPPRKAYYRAMRQAIVTPFAALCGFFGSSSIPEPSICADDNAEHILQAEKRYETIYNSTAAQLAIRREIRDIPDDIAENMMERLIDVIVLERGQQRVKDALRGLNSRDPAIAKAEKDANRGKPMNCFINIGGVFLYMVDYFEFRYPTEKRMDDYFLAYNPFCSYDIANPGYCLTDTVETEDGVGIDNLVYASIVLMIPLIHASFQYMKAGMTQSTTAHSSSKYFPDDEDLFEILDGPDGVKTAFEAYEYFDPSDPITIDQFIDQVALSQVIWSLAQLFGRSAIDALDRLQEKKGKLFLRFATTDISHGDFDLTDPLDPRAIKIKERFYYTVRRTWF